MSAQDRPATTDYRLSPTFVLRATGGLLVLLGLVVVVVTVLVLTVDLPVLVLVLVVLVGGVGVAGGAFLAMRRAVVVRLDANGYRVRYIRGAGVPAARWTDLTDVVTGSAAGHPVVEFRLRDGRTTTVPVDILAGSADDFVREIRNRARGSRPPGTRR